MHKNERDASLSRLPRHQTNKMLHNSSAGFRLRLRRPQATALLVGPSPPPGRTLLPATPPRPRRLPTLQAHHPTVGPRSQKPRPSPVPDSPLPSLLRALEVGPAHDLERALAAGRAELLSPKEQTVLLRRQPDWRSTLRVFRWLRSRRESYAPNVIHYNVVLRALGRAQRWDELRLCWIDMAADAVLPTNNTYSMLVDVYAKAGLAREALLWIKHMRARGIFPDEVTMSTVIRVLKDAGEFDRGHRFYRDWLIGEIDLGNLELSEADGGSELGKHFLSTELFKAGGRGPVMPPAGEEGLVRKLRLAATYNALIDLYGKAGRMKDASEAFGEMLRAGVAPDAVTFNTMIHICGSNGNLAEAESLFSKMEEKRITPDIKTYNIFISLYGDMGDVDAVLKWYRMIREVGLLPDIVTNRAVVHILCKRKMVQEVEVVIADMEQYNMRVDQQSLPVIMELYVNEGLHETANLFLEKYYIKEDISSKISAAIMDVYAERGLWTEAETIFTRKKNSGYKLDVLEYNVMIKAYGKAKHYDKALFLFGNMRSTGTWPDECTYNSLVQMLSCGDLAVSARDHLAKMQEAGFRPCCTTFSAVIACYARFGQVAEAAEVYQEMIRVGIEPNEVVYGSLINAFAEAGRVDEAFFYFRQMQGSGIVANQITLTILIKAYSKVGFWKEAQDVYAHMKNMSGGPDIVASNSMIDLYADLGMVHEAQSIFNNLRDKGHADGVSFATMMYLYKSMGMLDEAMELAQEMQESGLLNDCASFNNVMTSYATNGQLRECGELLHQMLKRKILPDQASFKTMFVILKKGGIPVEMVTQLQDAYEIGKPYSRNAIVTLVFSVVGLHNFALESCEAFTKADVGLDAFAYNIGIYAYGASGKVDKALRMYMKMQDVGAEPDIVTYISLVVCYGRAGLVEGVKRIYSQLNYGEIELNESLFMAIIYAYKDAGRHDLAALVDQEMRFSFSNHSDNSDVDNEENPNHTASSENSCDISGR